MSHQQQHGGHHGSQSQSSPSTRSSSPYVDNQNPQHNVTAAQVEKALGAPEYQKSWFVRVAVFDGSGNVTNGNNVTETELQGLDTEQGINTSNYVHLMSDATLPIEGQPCAIQISTGDGEWDWASDAIAESASRGVS